MRRRAAAIRRTLAGAGARRRTHVGKIGSGELGATELSALRERYAPLDVPALAYGTVRDFSDSLESLTGLATAQGDLKDAQRPWMLKALWSLLPGGGRVIEIGAGQPYVADLLQRSGFDVTVVDPYDGSANGPVEYARYRERYPGLTFVRARFEDVIVERLAMDSYDAVFSISVLEHLSEPELESVATGIRSVLCPGGWSVHNVDHSVVGLDQTVSLSRLTALARLHGVSERSLGALLRQAEEDPETYFLSAESHERWRAYLGLAYEDYPMRRIISISVAGTKENLG